MNVSFADDDDPDYEPSQESEDQLCNTDCEGCGECTEYDHEYFYEGTGEDAVLSGLINFIINRKNLHACHIPLYKEILVSLILEADELYC